MFEVHSSGAVTPPRRRRRIVFASSIVSLLLVSGGTLGIVAAHSYPYLAVAILGGLLISVGTVCIIVDRLLSHLRYSTPEQQ